MDRYEKSAEWLIKRGDAIISRRKRKAAMIKKVSFTVSGLCAAIIVGVGIWHNSSIKNLSDMNHLSEENIVISTTIASTEITTQPKQTVSTSAKPVNVTTTQTSIVSAIAENKETKQSVNETTLNTTKAIVTEITEPVTEVTNVVTLSINVTTNSEQSNIPETIHTTAASGTQAPADTDETTTTTPIIAYSFLSFGNKYRTISTTVNEELLSDEPIDNVQLFDRVGKELPIDKTDLYSIEGYSNDIIAVLKTPEDDGYHICVNMNYKPENLGELMEGIGLEKNWEIINAEYIGLNSFDKECSYTNEELMNLISNLKSCKRDDDGKTWDMFLKISFENTEIDGYVTDMLITKRGYVVFYDIIFFSGTDTIPQLIN